MADFKDVDATIELKKKEDNQESLQILGLRDQDDSSYTANVKLKVRQRLTSMEEGQLGDVTNYSGDSSQTYTIQKNPTIEAHSANKIDEITPKLHETKPMVGSIKLLDEYLSWCECTDLLLDQPDYFTIGVIGLQGTGKSTIMSKLAGDLSNTRQSGATFITQSQEQSETASHCTEGIYMHVTSERTILLDCQPLLSPSILSLMIQSDYKYSSEYRSYENCLHIESLQLANFMFSVCNVVIVVLDWFVDLNFIRFLHTAEMTKPPIPGPLPESEDGKKQFKPQIVFVLNRADQMYFTNENHFTTMQKQIDDLMISSSLDYKGPLGMDGSCGMENWSSISQNNVNFFMLPDFGLKVNKNDIAFNDFENLMESLKSQLFGLPRNQIANNTQTERGWLHFASRMWESIRKSALLSEYNRLISQSIHVE